MASCEKEEIVQELVKRWVMALMHEVMVLSELDLDWFLELDGNVHFQLVKMKTRVSTKKRKKAIIRVRTLFRVLANGTKPSKLQLK